MAGRLLLAAGGTGGHMFPAQALAEILKAEGWDIALMTDARGQKHCGRIPADPVIEVQAASISPNTLLSGTNLKINSRQCDAPWPILSDPICPFAAVASDSSLIPTSLPGSCRKMLAPNPSHPPRTPM